MLFVWYNVPMGQLAPSHFLPFVTYSVLKSISLDEVRYLKAKICAKLKTRKEHKCEFVKVMER